MLSLGFIMVLLAIFLPMIIKVPSPITSILYYGGGAMIIYGFFTGKTPTVRTFSTL
jgi:hypothetical protein